MPVSFSLVLCMSYFCFEVLYTSVFIYFNITKCWVVFIEFICFDCSIVSKWWSTITDWEQLCYSVHTFSWLVLAAAVRESVPLKKPKAALAAAAASATDEAEDSSSSGNRLQVARRQSDWRSWSCVLKHGDKLYQTTFQVLSGLKWYRKW